MVGEAKLCVPVELWIQPGLGAGGGGLTLSRQKPGVEGGGTTEKEGTLADARSVVGLLPLASSSQHASLGAWPRLQEA